MPRGLPLAVKKSLEKSRDSALLAVEIYNKPAIKFKSGGYIVLMVIAWTSLFHAIFFKKNLKPFYKKNNRFIKRDGDFMYWELDECVRKYFLVNTENPIRKNIEFFVPLRNMVEHKSIPEIDSDIFAECQSFLLNYDKIIEKEFGVKFTLKESLSFALQMYPSSTSLNNAVISNSSNKPIVDFIKSYRSSITVDILNSGEYSFKAFLIQVANHQSQSSLPVQFVAYDKLTDAQKNNVNRVAALVKEKTVHVNVANRDLLKPSAVVSAVQALMDIPKVNRYSKEIDKFTQDTHTRCWKKYGVRPHPNSDRPEITKPEYCIYDIPNKCYLFTQTWVDFLAEELNDETKYNTLYLPRVDEIQND